MTVKKMNAALFREYLQREEPVLVEFYAPWCSYCRRIEPAFTRLAARYGEQLTIARMNIDEEPELTEQERIELVPTFVLYHRGEALADLVAPQSYEQLEQLVLEHL